MDRGESFGIGVIFGACMAGLLVGLTVSLSSERKRQNLQKEALDRGYAEYRHDDSGKAVFSWVEKAGSNE